MKFTLLYIILLIFVASSAHSQKQERHDGISISGISSNRDMFFYGEPLSFQFSFQNNTEEEKKYWKMQTGINIYLKLIDKKTNQVIYDNQDAIKLFAEDRERIKNSIPKGGYYYGPFDVLLADFHLGEVFYRIPFSNTTTNLYTNSISQDLKILDEGVYQLDIEYRLYPGDNKIYSTHTFEVVPLPEEEKSAYADFVRTTTYASGSYFYGDNSYSSSHSESYENFIKKHSTSMFAQYAYDRLIGHIYYYGSTPIKEDVKKFHFDQYLNLNKINLSNLRYSQATNTIVFLKNKNVGQDKKKVIDNLLKELSSEDPALSDVLIKSSDRLLKIKGLKNYACETP